MPWKSDGGGGSCPTTRPRKDLAEGAGEIHPLIRKGLFRSSPHRAGIGITLLLLALASPAHARWVRHEVWAWRPDPVVRPRTLTPAEMRMELCAIGSRANSLIDARANALRCALRYGVRIP